MTVFGSTAGEGGCQGVESRWSMCATPGWASEGPARWHLNRLRSRLDPPREWHLVRDKRAMIVAETFLSSCESSATTVASTAPYGCSVKY